MTVKISEVLDLLSKGGGAAFSNSFKVTFEKPGSGGNNVFTNVKKVLKTFDENHLGEDSSSGLDESRYISLMADEVTLPGYQAATGQVNGLYTGSGQFQYPHTRLFNDVTISWICDANMTPLKFLQVWMQTIFNEYDKDGNQYIDAYNQKNSKDVQSRERNRTVRLNYPDDYTLQLSILKAEKGNSGELARPSVRYVFDGVYPYSIDSIPLTFGNAQTVKVSANFYYERWYTYYNSQWSTPSETTL